MADSRMSVSMVLEMVDRFSSKTGRISQSISRMSSGGQKAMSALRRSSDMAYQGLDKLGNRYTAFLTGAGGAYAVKSITDMETRLTRLGIQSNRSADEIERLRQEVVKTAQATDVRVNPDFILDAVDKIIEKTGDLELATGNLRNIGLAMQATGANGADIGAMIADLSEKFDIKKPEDLFETIDLLTNQGKAGAFTLQNFATQGERVTAAYSITGRVTKQAAREMGAMLQMIRKGVGAPEQAATSFEALMRTLNDGSKRKLLTGAGIQIMDPEDPERMRAVTDIVKDVVKLTGGDAVKLSAVFDSEAMRALNIVAAEYKKTGAFESLDGFMSQASDGGAILADAFKGADRSAAKWQTIITAIKNGVFNTLEKPISAVADKVGEMETSTLDKVVGYGLGAAGILGGLALGVKGHKYIKGAFGRKSGGALGNALGSVAGGVTGMVQPVMVMNWPSSMGGFDAGGFGHGFNKSARNGMRKSSRIGRFLGKAGKYGRFAKYGKKALKAVPYLGAGLVALDIGSAALSGEDGAMGEAFGSAGGGLAGAAAGAAIGSIIPGLGTAIGAAIGGVLGSLGGGELGRYLATDSEDKKLSGQIEIKVDSEGRPAVNASMNNGSVDTVIDQGVIMGGAL